MLKDQKLRSAAELNSSYSIHSKSSIDELNFPTFWPSDFPTTDTSKESVVPLMPHKSTKASDSIHSEGFIDELNFLIFQLFYFCPDSFPGNISESEKSDNTAATEELYAEFMTMTDAQIEAISAVDVVTLAVCHTNYPDPNDPDFIFETCDDTKPQETSYDSENLSDDCIVLKEEWTC